jgi:transposase
VGTILLQGYQIVEAIDEGYGGKNKGNKGRQLPSDHYPNAEIQERHIYPDVAPSCNACGCEMKDSGLSEVSESLSVIPKRFVVIRQFRHKFFCRNCHSAITSAEAPARIVPRSSYDDDLIIVSRRSSRHSEDLQSIGSKARRMRK